MITVCNIADAPTVAKRLAPGGIISLLDPGETAPELVGEALLRLRFEDIRDETEGSVPARREQVECLVAFARTLDPRQEILVHCRHGMGRSPSAAYIIACVHTVAAESELAAILRQRAPSAKPNKRMVELADEILGRGGRMIQAIRAMPERRPNDRYRGPISFPEFPAVLHT
jgi:predicted protein tyrosine phosphatase